MIGRRHWLTPLYAARSWRLSSAPVESCGVQTAGYSAGAAAAAWYIGAGAVAQTVWNHLHGFSPSHGVKDYDVVYFDPDDLTPDGEQAVEAKVAGLLDSAVTVDVTNEARVHTWYQRRYGQPLMPYRSTEHAIATWPSTATSVGVRTDGDSLDVCAPYGLSDLFGLVVRPNTTLVSREVYEEKAERWRQLWPLLTVLAWPTL